MPTQDNANEVTLLIAGKAHKAWSSYRIDSDLQTPADAWDVALGLPDGTFPPIVEPGAQVQVRIGTDTVLMGQIDDVAHSVSRSAELTMCGRDLVAVLLDSSAPIFVAKDITLEEVIAKVVRPLGVSKVVIKSDTPTLKTEKISVDPGMSAWEVLLRSAEANGLWPWFEPDGTLVVGGPDYTTEPVATLFLNKSGTNNNVEKLEYLRSIADRFSEVTVLAQAHGVGQKGQNGIQGKAKDPDMKVYRPYIVTESDVANAEEATRRALKIMNDSRLHAVTLRATVKGHRTSAGTLWTPGQRIHVKSDVHGIDEVWFLMSRRFSGGRERPTITELILKEDGIWTMEAYKDKQPTAKAGKRKGRKGKKAKLIPTVIPL